MVPSPPRKRGGPTEHGPRQLLNTEQLRSELGRFLRGRALELKKSKPSSSISPASHAPAALLHANQSQEEKQSQQADRWATLV
jgi:hypothetical protein